MGGWGGGREKETCFRMSISHLDVRCRFFHQGGPLRERVAAVEETLTENVQACYLKVSPNDEIHGKQLYFDSAFEDADYIFTTLNRQNCVQNGYFIHSRAFYK